MARVPFDWVVRSRGGPVVEAQELYIFNRGTNDTAEVWSAETGGGLVLQPLVPDGEGRFTDPEIWVEAGPYDVFMPGDAVNPVQRWEAISAVDLVGTAKLAEENVFTEVNRFPHDGIRLGLTPSADNYPTNPSKWLSNQGATYNGRWKGQAFDAIDPVDPPEQTFSTTGTQSGSRQGPNGNGTGFEGGKAGSAGGGTRWKPFVRTGPGMGPDPADNDQSLQGRFAAIGGTMMEDMRFEDLKTTLSAAYDPATDDTISVVDDLSEIASVVDGADFAWHEQGTAEVGIGPGKAVVRYAGRTLDTLFGVRKISGGAGPFGVDDQIVQKQRHFAGKLELNTTRRKTNKPSNGFALHPDGTTQVGERAIGVNPTEFFTVGGGPMRTLALGLPSSIVVYVYGYGATTVTYNVVNNSRVEVDVDGAGSAVVTYHLVCRTPNGHRVLPYEIEITGAPDEFDDDHYIVVEFVVPTGVFSFDTLRDSVVDVDLALGAFIRQRSVFGTNGSGNPIGGFCDRGDPVAGINEIQSITVTNATEGDMVFGYEGVLSDPTDYEAVLADDAVLEAGLETIPALAGNIAVLRDGTGTKWTVEFINGLSATNVTPLTFDPSSTLINGNADPDDEDALPVGVSLRTRINGSDAPYVENTRDETADGIFDGMVSTKQFVELTRQVETPGASLDGNEARLFTQLVGGRHILYLEDATGIKQILDDVTTADPLRFIAGIDCSGNPNYPAADAGHVYKVTVPGKIGGAAGTPVQSGDTLICTVDGSLAGTQAAVGANWIVTQVNVDGAVIGPAAATDGHIPQFDGTTGTLIKDGLALDTDVALAGDSDVRVASQKAMKAYADAIKAEVDARYRQLLGLTADAQATSLTGAGTFPTSGNGSAASATGTSVWRFVAIDSDDWEVAGRATRLRLRAAAAVNGTGPGRDMTVGLYPITAFAGGAANTLALTLGAAVVSVTFTSAELAANASVAEKYSAPIALPSDGKYIVAVEIAGGGMAANSQASFPTVAEINNV